MQYEFPKITRARIASGTPEDMTDEEKSWWDIMSSDAPEIEVKKKRVSVCAIADVVEYDSNAVKVVYDGTEYTIKKPTNSLQIARARERSVMAAFETLAAQFCVCVGAVPCKANFDGVPVEVIQLLSNVAERFFFTPYY